MIRLIKKHAIAVRLRTNGKSITYLEKRLGVARSTLSLWLRHVPLSKTGQATLRRSKLRALQLARRKAVHWHRQGKQQRLAQAAAEAAVTVSRLNLEDETILELAVAMLYMGNTDPQLLKLFVSAMRRCYAVSTDQLSCQLHLRADQDAEKEKRYWSRLLAIPVRRFKHVAFDQRTRGSTTYAGYHGVCAVRVSNVAIQRKLISIAKQFTEAITLRA